MDEHQPEQQSPPQDSPPDAEDHPQPTAAADGKTPAIDPAFELVEFEYRGLKWQIPKDRGQWDMNVAFAFEENRRLHGIYTLLGGSPENVRAVRDQVYTVCRTHGEVDELIEQAVEFLNKHCVGG